MEKQEEQNFFGFDQAMFVTLVSAFGYLSAFAFNMGFCSYFEIPPEFIRIGIEDILLGIWGIALFLVAASYLLNFVLPLVSRKEMQADTRGKRIYLLVAVSVVIGIFLWTAYRSWGVIIIELIVVVTLALIIFINTHVENFLVRVRKKHKVEYTEDDEPAVRDTFSGLFFVAGRRWTPFILLLFVGTAIGYLAGVYNARTLKEFYLIEVENLALLKRYGNFFVLKEYSEAPVTFEAPVKLLSDSEIAGKSLTLRKFASVPIVFKVERDKAEPKK